MDAHRVGVGQMTIAIAVRRRERQREHGRVRAEGIRVDAQPFDEREHLQQREPLAVRRHDADVDVAIPPAERRARCPLECAARSSSVIGEPAARSPAAYRSPIAPP